MKRHHHDFGQHRRYWTDYDLERLERLSDFDEMADLATEIILPRMIGLHPGKEVSIICGAISSGNRETNLNWFKLAIKAVETRGHLVFNQLPFETAILALAAPWHDRGEYCHDILDRFYKPIYRSGLVARSHFIPNWVDSFGARWERRELGELQVPMEDLTWDEIKTAN